MGDDETQPKLQFVTPEVDDAAISAEANDLFGAEMHALGAVQQRVLEKLGTGAPNPMIQTAARLFFDQLNLANLTLGGLGGAVAYVAQAGESAMSQIDLGPTRTGS